MDKGSNDPNPIRRDAQNKAAPERLKSSMVALRDLFGDGVFKDWKGKVLGIKKDADVVTLHLGMCDNNQLVGRRYLDLSKIDDNLRSFLYAMNVNDAVTMGGEFYPINSATLFTGPQDVLGAFAQLMGGCPSCGKPLLIDLKALTISRAE